MVQIDETGHVEILVPLCRWCEEPLDGQSKDGFHVVCFEEYRDQQRRLEGEWDKSRKIPVW